jgi:hypothetical protein
MKFDDIFTEVGEFGPYQRRNYSFLVVGWILTAPVMALSVFILGLPDHRFVIHFIIFTYISYSVAYFFIILMTREAGC